MSRSAVILFGHGSRDPAWKRPMEAVAARLAARHPALIVRCAYLELEVPDLQAAIDGAVLEGAGTVAVLPLFLGVGRHAREDLPRLAAAAQERHPGVPVRVQPAVGEDPALLDLLSELAARSAF